MKTIKTLILATLITFSSQISANTTGLKDDLNPVYKQVEMFLKTPETLVYKDIIVTVNFKLNEDNEIMVVSIDSDDYEITNFIKTTLNQKVLSIDKSNNYIFYSIPVKFIAQKHFKY